jgi:hypothetical protein
LDPGGADRYGTPLDRPDGTRTPVFNGEPTREQTQQGDLGDCGMVATLGAVAGHRPEAITRCVRETGDGNYEVRLHEAHYSPDAHRWEPTGQQLTLTVTPDLPVEDSTPGKPAFADSASTGVAWPAVLEKAVAGIDQTWGSRRHADWEQRWQTTRESQEHPEVPLPEGYVRLNKGSTPGDRAETRN